MSELPKGWISLPLSDAVTPRGEKASPRDYPDLHFIGMDHVERDTGRIVGHVPASEMKSSAARFCAGDVLYGRLRPYLNKVTQPTFDGLASAEFIVIPENILVSSAYLALRLRSVDFVSFASSLNEGDRPRVDFGQIGAFRLHIPPLPEQRRIVAKVEELFSGLDAAEQSLTTARLQLGLYRQALLKAAFEGRLTARWRAANKAKLESPAALLQRIRTERQARHLAATEEWNAAVKAWEQAGKPGRKPAKPRKPKIGEPIDIDDLPPIPSGWAYLSFEELAFSIRNGISDKPTDQGELPIFRISAVRPMTFDMSDIRFLPDVEKYHSFRLSSGDLVFTRYNGSREYVGVAAVYRGNGSHAYPDKLIRCDVRSPRVDSGYLEKAVNVGVSRTFIEARMRTTAGQSGISGSDLKAMPVPVCGPEEQQQLNAITEPVLSQIDATETEITTNLQKIATLRQAILKRAFSGRLVPQDPADEPAAALLARLRASAPAKGKARQKSTRKVSA